MDGNCNVWLGMGSVTVLVGGKDVAEDVGSEIWGVDDDDGVSEGVEKMDGDGSAVLCNGFDGNAVSDAVGNGMTTESSPVCVGKTAVSVGTTRVAVGGGNSSAEYENSAQLGEASQGGALDSAGI